MYAKKELADKLIKKGFEREVAEAAVTKLESYSYIDDMAFAKAFVQENSRLSKMVLEAKLRAKGIDNSTFSEVLESVTDESQIESCRAIAEKYAKSHCIKDKADRQKLYASLSRRGYKFDIIKKSCSFLDEDDDFYEDF